MAARPMVFVVFLVVLVMLGAFGLQAPPVGVQTDAGRWGKLSTILLCAIALLGAMLFIALLRR